MALQDDLDALKRNWQRSPNWIFDYLGSLEPAVCKMACFVLGRTLQYGKLSDDISVSQFMRGIRRRSDGTVITPGTGLSRRTIVATIPKLLDTGLFLIAQRKSASGQSQATRFTVILQLPAYLTGAAPTEALPQAAPPVAPPQRGKRVAAVEGAAPEERVAIGTQSWEKTLAAAKARGYNTDLPW